MLEALERWTQWRLFWTLFLTAILFLDGVSHLGTTSSPPLTCLVNIENYETSSGTEQYCPSLDIFLLRYIKIVWDYLGSFDVVSWLLLFVAVIAVLQITRRFCGEHGPVEWFSGLKQPEQLTVILAFIFFFQFLVFGKTDQTLKLQQRAWISTNGALLYHAPVKGDPIGLLLMIINTGWPAPGSIDTRLSESDPHLELHGT